MKNSLLYILFIAITMNLTAQSDYDCIGRDEFYILKTGSDVKSANKLKASELKSSKAAEQLFGTDYKANKYVDKMSDEKFTRILYPDGLRLDIPEYEKAGIHFRIMSDKYTLFLEKGQAIKVGMKAEELKAIFPKSFSKRTVITNWAGMEGKTSFMVYFSRIRNNKLEIEDAWIRFILSNDNGILEQIRSVQPD